MEIIFQEYNLKGTIRSIKIFRPTRGSGGTLAYKSKINGKVFTFEMGDEGDWQPNCRKDLFNSDFMRYINTVIGSIERQRLDA